MSIYKCRIVLSNDELREFKILIEKFNKMVADSKFFDINYLKQKYSKMESSLVEGAYIYTDEDRDDYISFITCNNIIDYQCVIFNEIAFRFKVDINWIQRRAPKTFAIKKISYRLINNILIATIDGDDIYTF